MDDYSGGSAAAAAAALIVFAFFIFIFAVIGYVISAFFLMKIFDKAGVQGKWRAWVPIYNFMVFAKHDGRQSTVGEEPVRCTFRTMIVMLSRPPFSSAASSMSAAAAAGSSCCRRKCRMP